MTKKVPSPQFAHIVILGAAWGFAETGLGLGLQRCASQASGSIMTGVALLFLAAAWVLTGRALGIVFLVGLVTLLKLFDAALLSLPIGHGAVANPIFAFWMEALAFLLVIGASVRLSARKKFGRAALGAGAALIAAGLFPLVKFATGIPACVAAGTGIPLSLYYAPLAVGLSAVLAPAGFRLGERIAAGGSANEAFIRGKTFRYGVSPAALVVSLLLIAALRLAI